jgi:uncharacterized OB-fold protein
MTSPTEPYLLPERVQPVPLADGLDEPFWTGLRQEKLVLQRCEACETFQWGLEYVCYTCGRAEIRWAEVPKQAHRGYEGVIYSWERVWHPADQTLVAAVPYVVLLVELPDADGIRLVGNLIDPPDGAIPIDAPVTAAFEHHKTHSLLLWQLRDDP